RLATGLVTQSLAWMFAGLAITAVVSWVVASDASLAGAARTLVLPAIILQLVLVIGLSAGISRLSATLALGLFFAYAALTGFVFSIIVAAYSTATITLAFSSASAMFGASAVFGFVTKRDLSVFARFFMMALIGIIVSSFLNLLVFHSNGLSLIVSYLGVALFAGITAWDIQRIKNGDLAAMLGSMEKASVIGALHLYLDFINMFLFLLRIFGGGGNR
ncbi:MAG TPA: Bax inhibitor-1/YccA family protein, partial [Verrucomicrobiae bacterium]|nr:Bax inhibitor-1/YccA family protein [Verrucomicrobiae bacterium]